MLTLSPGGDSLGYHFGRTGGGEARQANIVAIVEEERSFLWGNDWESHRRYFMVEICLLFGQEN